MVGHDAHDYQLGLLANLQDENNKQKETTMENNQNNADLFQQLEQAKRDLSDKQVILDRVNAIGERNAHKLREALKTARHLIIEANISDDHFIKDHKDDIRQLVSLGMDDFTKKLTIRASWLVTLEVEAVVPMDFTEDDVEINMEEDIDKLFSGEFMEDPNIESDSFDCSVDCRSFNVHMEEN
jgi:hypothetical protein